MLIKPLQRPSLHVLLLVDIGNDLFTAFVVGPYRTQRFGVMTLCRCDVVEVAIIKVRADLLSGQAVVPAAVFL